MYSPSSFSIGKTTATLPAPVPVALNGGVSALCCPTALTRKCNKDSLELLQQDVGLDAGHIDFFLTLAGIARDDCVTCTDVAPQRAFAFLERGDVGRVMFHLQHGGEDARDSFCWLIRQAVLRPSPAARDRITPMTLSFMLSTVPFHATPYCPTFATLCGLASNAAVAGTPLARCIVDALSSWQLLPPAGAHGSAQRYVFDRRTLSLVPQPAAAAKATAEAEHCACCVRTAGNCSVDDCTCDECRCKKPAKPTQRAGVDAVAVAAATVTQPIAPQLQDALLHGEREKGSAVLEAAKPVPLDAGIAAANDANAVESSNSQQIGKVVVVSEPEAAAVPGNSSSSSSSSSSTRRSKRVRTEVGKFKFCERCDQYHGNVCVGKAAPASSVKRARK